MTQQKPASFITSDMMDDEYPTSGQHSGHRRPYNAGDADAYYWRECKPNFDYHHKRFNEDEMEQWQIDEYLRGYEENPSDKKVF